MGMLYADLLFRVKGAYSANGDYAAGPPFEHEFQQRMTNGTTANKADKPFHDDRSLAGSANEDLDLTTLTDAHGVALGAAEVALIMITCPTTNGAAMRITPGSSNGWTAILGGTSPQIDILPGACFVYAVPPAAALAVSGSDKVLNVANQDGSTGTYTITVLARSA